MKKRLLKILSGIIVASSLLCISANAVESGWHIHCQVGENSYSWEYVYSDGTFASGWNYIDGDWYYFDPVDSGCYVGKCYVASDGKLGGDIPNSLITINGQNYYFDNNGRLLTNRYVYSNRGYTYWLDDNGHPIRC